MYGTAPQDLLYTVYYSKKTYFLQTKFTKIFN